MYGRDCCAITEALKRPLGCFEVVSTSGISTFAALAVSTYLNADSTNTTATSPITSCCRQPLVSQGTWPRARICLSRLVAWQRSGARRAFRLPRILSGTTIASPTGGAISTTRRATCSPRCSSATRGSPTSSTRELGAVRTFLVDMNALFEQFIESVVTEALRGSPLEVSGQESLRAVIRDDATGRTYARVRPDLVITETQLGQRVPLDAKYKRYDLKKVNSGDIYQTFVYAYALGTTTRRSAAIIHPTTEGGALGSLSVHSTAGNLGARITLIGIDVPAMLVALGGSPSERSASLETVAEILRKVCGFTGGDRVDTTPDSGL